MKDAFNILLLHMFRHQRRIFRYFVVEILVWLSSIADIVYITRKFLPGCRITNVSINISNSEAIFTVGTDATYAGTERDLNHILIDMTGVIVFSFFDDNIVKSLRSYTLLD